MRQFMVAVIGLGLTACASDYKVTPGTGNNDVGDTAQPPGDTAVPQDTADTGPVVDEPGRPVAVCDVSPNPITPPFEAATWDGSGSYDPDGGAIVDWNWTIIAQPSGSSLSIGGTGPIRGGFVPQYAGTYTGRLVVTNDGGVESNPCTVDLEAIPAEDLWVEMYWTHSGDDMDLHLLAPGHASTSDYTSSWDCYYGNCVSRSGLDWGTPGAENNPVLDLDDIPGTGPENINIDVPENGTYTVVVHDYPGSVYNGANDVTVNIYLDGSLMWTDTRTISGENTYNRFAQIDYGSRTVTSL